MPLISIHIPKTGGTTFLELLSKHYGNRLLLDYGLSGEEGSSKINQGLYGCVHGHFIADKYKSVKRGEYVFWLRNPLQRLFSQYYFWKKNKYPHNIAWRRFYFEEWSFSDFALSPVARNKQSKYIGTLDIDSAKAIGITEFFNESMELFNIELRMRVDPSTIPHHRRNIESDTRSRYQIKDKKLEAAILEYHREDYEMYLKGLAHFRKKYDAISDKLSLAYWGRAPKAVSQKSVPFSLQKFIKDKGVENIVGTYYFGDGWPINMWDTFRRDVVDTYLDKMKADGFNTVILLIPVSVYRLSEQNKEHYMSFRDDLSFMMEQIQERNMYFMFRLGYAWDGFPIKVDRGRLCFSILAGGGERELVKVIFKDLWEVAKKQDGFLYGFITWEDMLMFAWNRATRSAPDVRRALAKELGYKNSSGIIPTIDSVDFNDYLDFIDMKLSDLFYDLKEVFPRLSAEVRVDTTPFTDETGNQQHYVHNRQFVETDCDIIGTYFATYMIHGTPNAKHARMALNEAHKGLRNVAPQKKIFIDQLLLIIKEKRFDGFPKLSDIELQKFMDWLPDWLDQYTIGYATWSFSDYLWDIIFNGSFRYGLLGWEVVGTPTFVDGQHQRYVELKLGDSILGDRIKHRSPWITDGVVVIEADVGEHAELVVSLSGVITLTLNRADFLQAPTGNGKVAVVDFAGESKYIKVSLASGNAKIYRIGVGKEIVSNGGYDIKLSEGDSASRIANLNRTYLSRAK
jgi:hypothetical protein